MNLLAFVIAFCAAACGNLTPAEGGANGRITPASISEHPYLVQILWEGYMSGTGVLITDQHVLTTTIMVSVVPVKDLAIKAGATHLDDAGVVVAAKTFLRHRKYDALKHINDLALITLKASVQGPNIKSIGLGVIPLRNDDIVTMAGWGRLPSGQRSNRLREADVPILDNTRCQRVHRGRLSPQHVCAPSPGPRQCIQDMGGVLIKDGKLYGMIADNMCAFPSSVTVYTELAKVG